MFLINPSLSMGQNWEPTSFLVFTTETWSNEDHFTDPFSTTTVLSPSGPLCAVAPVAPVAPSCSNFSVGNSGIRSELDLLGQDTTGLPGESHLKDLELSIEIRRSPGPGAFFSWTFWADLGVKKHLGDPVLMGLYQIYQLSPNSWRLITMIRSASFDPNCQTACSPNKGGPRRPSSARSSEKVSCLPNLLMAWRGPAGTCHFAELVLRIPYCIYSRMTLLVYDMIWYNII